MNFQYNRLYNRHNQNPKENANDQSIPKKTRPSPSRQETAAGLPTHPPPPRLLVQKGTSEDFSYFGKMADDPQGEKALNLWLEQKDDLLAGRTPRTGTGPTVEDICN